MLRSKTSESDAIDARGDSMGEFEAAAKKHNRIR